MQLLPKGLSLMLLFVGLKSHASTGGRTAVRPNPYLGGASDASANA
jgi:hypothetical protein